MLEIKANTAVIGCDMSSNGLKEDVLDVEMTFVK